MGPTRTSIGPLLIFVIALVVVNGATLGVLPLMVLEEVLGESSDTGWFPLVYGPNAGLGSILLYSILWPFLLLIAYLFVQKVPRSYGYQKKVFLSQIGLFLVVLSMLTILLSGAFNLAALSSR